jgi:hypothetical protein
MKKGLKPHKTYTVARDAAQGVGSIALMKKGLKRDWAKGMTEADVQRHKLEVLP